MNTAKLSAASQAIIEDAIDFATESEHAAVEPEHVVHAFLHSRDESNRLLLSGLGEWEKRDLTRRLQMYSKVASLNDPSPTGRLEGAVEKAAALGGETNHLLSAVLSSFTTAQYGEHQTVPSADEKKRSDEIAAEEQRRYEQEYSAQRALDYAQRVTAKKVSLSYTFDSETGAHVMDLKIESGPGFAENADGPRVIKGETAHAVIELVGRTLGAESDNSSRMTATASSSAEASTAAFLTEQQEPHMADQEQVPSPKKKPDLKTIEATYSFVKHEGDDAGGVHKVKAKAVDEDGRVVLDGDVSIDQPKVDGSDDKGYWASMSKTIVAALLAGDRQTLEDDPDNGDEDLADEAARQAPIFRTEAIEQELFDTLILDRTLRPDEKLGPFFQGTINLGSPALTNIDAPGILHAHCNVTVRFIEMHIDGDLTDEERRQFVQGTALTVCIGDKPYRMGPTRPIEADDKIRTWTGPLGPFDADHEVGHRAMGYQGLKVPARQAFCVKHDHSPAATALLPKLRLFRCVAKVGFVRDLQ